MHIGMIEPPAANRAVGSEQVGAARPEVRLDTSLELLLERAPVTQIARVLATVVATAGSTYRKPGARMLIMADGSYLGLLSGGCLEADLKLHAGQSRGRGARSRRARHADGSTGLAGFRSRIRGCTARHL